MATRLTYTPNNGEKREWDLEVDDLPSPSLEAIEDVTGWTAGEWIDLLSRGSIRALRALLWVKLRESDPDLLFDSVEFTASEVEIAAVKKAKSGKA